MIPNEPPFIISTLKAGLWDKFGLKSMPTLMGHFKSYPYQNWSPLRSVKVTWIQVKKKNE